MEAKLAYLNRHNPDIKIVSPEEAVFLEAGLVPSLWKYLLTEPDFEEQKVLLLNAWAIFEPELSNTVSYLAEHLIGIDLITHNSRYSLLYVIKNTEDAILYYEGGNPFQKEPAASLEAFWDNLPAKLSGFYDLLHNGFYYYADESTGLSPVESVTSGSDRSYTFCGKVSITDNGFWKAVDRWMVIGFEAS